MTADQPPITALLVAWSHGDARALDALMPVVYDQLRSLAGHFLRGERAHHTLVSSALVSEAFLRLVELEQVNWNDRAHFFALCARLMRRILIDHARKQRASKRGDGREALQLDEDAMVLAGRHPDLLTLDQAMNRLAERDPQQARIVELRYFGGLDRDEIALVLGVSSATVTRRWRMARAWLFGQLRGGRRPVGGSSMAVH